VSGYEIHRDQNGFIDAIEKDEVVAIHLVPGSKRNEMSAEDFVAEVNALRDACEQLPLDYFITEDADGAVFVDMEQIDAADFKDHADAFVAAMVRAKVALFNSTKELNAEG
jgi:hypothetical protein